jgi:predicted restriction endonuclease
MNRTGAITIEEIIEALSALGGEAEAKHIKDKVTEMRGGMPSHYGSSHSYRETIQKKIEDHCPESANYRTTNEAHFKKLRRGYYKLVGNKKVQETKAELINEETKDFKYSETEITETERKAVIDSRVGQGVFREQLIMKWGACSVTGCNQTDLLTASHIKPWSKLNNSERLDVDNGFLLIPNLDNLFDKGYITFRKNGFIRYSVELSLPSINLLGLNENMKIQNLNESNVKYLEYHFNHVFKA